MPQSFLNRVCIIACSLGLTTSPMEQSDNQKNLWLKTIHQEYKKLNYISETPLMKQELGRIAYNFRAHPSKLENNLIFTKYSNLSKKKQYMNTMLPFTIWASISVASLCGTIKYFDILCLYFVSLLFSHLMNDTTKSYEEYGSLILEEIKKEEFNEEWRRMQNEE